MNGIPKREFNLEKRVSEIERGIKLFEKGFGIMNLVIDPDSHYKIGGLYKKVLFNHVKPLVPKYVNKFKMGSLTALSANKEQPIQIGGSISDKKEQRNINAKLSFFLAMNLILDMSRPYGFDMQTGILSIDKPVQIVKQQHLNWLSVKKLDVFPIFPVASFYYCYFIIFQNRYNAMAT